MKRSKFSLSNYKLATFDMGDLVPVGLVEVLPGDTFQHSVSALLRCTPLVAPVMHPVDVCVHSWFVPNRILWTGWEDFIAGVNPDLIPFFAGPTSALGSLHDYFGVGTGIVGGPVNVLPYRAYNKIWNEFYRDQDLQTEVAEDSVLVKSVAWQKDYFTTARPWPLKGNAITVPVSGDALVRRRQVSGAPLSTDAVRMGLNPLAWDEFENAVSGVAVEMRADMSQGVAGLGAPRVEIDDLREAFALQRYHEARARFGSRYTEYLAYLGVRSGDARLQRPEYLGGGKSTISFSEVLQTAEGTNPVGEMAGHGITAFKSPRYRKFFTEHGYVMTLMFVRPKSMYVSGTPRTFTRQTREDYWQKELEHIGQQAVSTEELYSPALIGTVFGYQDRYDEYRRHWSSVSGEFRTILNYWHMGRIFASAPTLNESFILCDPSKRNFAEQTQHSLYAMVYHKLAARRLVSGGATPFVR